MKLLYSILLCLITVSVGYGQTLAIDTLFWGDTPVLHENPFGSGYIAGTNSYGDIGKYQRFDLDAGNLLYGMQYFFAVKNIVETADTLNMVVKTVAENGAPDSLLAVVSHPLPTLPIRRTLPTPPIQLALRLLRRADPSGPVAPVRA